jgi:predicted neuraminidase
MTIHDEGIVELGATVRPGQLYRAPSEGERVDAMIPPAGAEAHAANLLEMPNGDLLCAWFSGSHEGRGDIDIVVARLPHGQAQWSTPVKVSDDPTRSEQNPVLFAAPDGTVWLLYTAQETRGVTSAEWSRRVAAGEATGGFTMQWTAEIRRQISRDNGQTWGPVEVFSHKPSSFCRQPLLVLSNGDWLFPMYYSLEAPGHGDDYSVIWISSDQGATWSEHPVPESRGRVHASVIELDPGKLVAFFRSRAADNVYRSLSADNGRTWTVPQRTALPNNNASIQAVKLQSGAIAVIHNHCASDNADPAATVWPRERNPVTIALTEDAGETWPIMRDVDQGDGFRGDANRGYNRRSEYPTVIQTRDGRIHVAYSYRGRQYIKYVRVTEAWLRATP